EAYASSGESEILSVGAARGGGFGFARKHLEQRGDVVAQLAPLEDHVDGAVREKKLGALESFGQFFAHRLLDHARAGEADERLRFGDDDVRDHGEACGNAAHRRVGEHGYKRNAALAEARERRRRLGHLQQGQQALLHARAAAGAETNERNMPLETHVDAAHEALADDRTHGSAHEVEFEGARDDRHVFERSVHDDQGVAFAGLALRFVQPILIALQILEFEHVDRRQIGAYFLARMIAVEKQLEPLARAEPHVVIAFRTDVLIGFDFSGIKHRAARRALAPYPFRDGLAHALALDLRGDQLVEPTHGVSSAVALRALSIAVRRLATKDGTSVNIFSGLAAFSSMRLTMALPTTTASAILAISAAVSGARMPKPTPTGSSVCLRMPFSFSRTSPMSRWPAPVTPRRDT